MRWPSAAGSVRHRPQGSRVEGSRRGEIPLLGLRAYRVSVRPLRMVFECLEPLDDGHGFGVRNSPEHNRTERTSGTYCGLRVRLRGLQIYFLVLPYFLAVHVDSRESEIVDVKGSNARSRCLHVASFVCSLGVGSCVRRGSPAYYLYYFCYLTAMVRLQRLR